MKTSFENIHSPDFTVGRKDFQKWTVEKVLEGMNEVFKGNYTRRKFKKTQEKFSQP